MTDTQGNVGLGIVPRGEHSFMANVEGKDGSLRGLKEWLWSHLNEWKRYCWALSHYGILLCALEIFVCSWLVSNILRTYRTSWVLNSQCQEITLKNMSLDDDGSSYISALHDMVFFSLWVNNLLQMQASGLSIWKQKSREVIPLAAQVSTLKTSQCCLASQFSSWRGTAWLHCAFMAWEQKNKLHCAIFVWFRLIISSYSYLFSMGTRRILQQVVLGAQEPCLDDPPVPGAPLGLARHMKESHRAISFMASSLLDWIALLPQAKIRDYE